MRLTAYTDYTLRTLMYLAVQPEQAATIAEIVAEMHTTRESERAGRLIDQDQESSMEKKKREGYF